MTRNIAQVGEVRTRKDGNRYKKVSNKVWTKVTDPRVKKQEDEPTNKKGAIKEEEPSAKRQPQQEVIKPQSKEQARKTSLKKFNRMNKFSQALPKARKQIESDINKRGLSEDKISACIARLIDITHIRQGNESFARNNGTYGATTLLKKHVNVNGNEVTLDFPGKDKKRFVGKYDMPILAPVLSKLLKLDGEALFQTKDKDGNIKPINSDSVKKYLGKMTTKDFRAYTASRLFTELASRSTADSYEARKNEFEQIVKAVATTINNTPEMCKTAYIDPVCQKAFMDGIKMPTVKTKLATSMDQQVKDEKNFNDFINSMNDLYDETREDKQQVIESSESYLKSELYKKIQRQPKGKGHEIQLSKDDVKAVLTFGKVGFISSGRNPAIEEDMKLTDQQITERENKLKQELIAKGYTFQNIKGKYGEEEDSILVMIPDASRDELVQMGEQFNQDSVIYSDGDKNEMIFTTGENKSKKHIGNGWKELENADNFYSMVKTPSGEIKFTLDFDFDKIVKSLIMKSRKLPVGTIRNWSNGTYKKVANNGKNNDWVKVKKESLNITESESFKKWFKGSKVVDDKGKPLVVYHGTPSNFSEFSEKYKGERTKHNTNDVAFHFTNNSEIASTYAQTTDIELAELYNKVFGKLPKTYDKEITPNIMPVYLSIKNPFMLKDTFVINEDIITNAKRKGHDGIIAKVSKLVEYVAFKPNQIKSATGNNGNFDPNNADITKSLKSWFGDWKKDPNNSSKMVNSDGTPKIFYHGTDKDFDTFKYKKANRNYDGNEQTVKAQAFFFSDNEKTAKDFATKNLNIVRNDAIEGQDYNMMRVFLNIRKPFDLTDETDSINAIKAKELEQLANIEINDLEEWTEIHAALDNPKVISAIINAGYDGVLLRELDKAPSYAVFNPNQIKSIFNDGDYDPDNDNITKSLPIGTIHTWKNGKHIKTVNGWERYVEKKQSSQQGITEKQAKENFKKWFGDSKVVDKKGNPKPTYPKDKKAIAKILYRGDKPSKNKFDNPQGIYFAEQESIAEAYSSGKVYKCYLKIENPLVMNERNYEQLISHLRNELEYMSDIGLESEDNWLFSELKEAYIHFRNSPGSESIREFYDKVITKHIDENTPDQEVYDHLYALIDEMLFVPYYETSWKSLDILNPYIQTLTEYDGIIRPHNVEYYKDTGNEYIVFNPTQIKSVDNIGTFDPNNPDITKSLEIEIKGISSINELTMSQKDSLIKSLSNTLYVPNKNINTNNLKRQPIGEGGEKHYNTAFQPMEDAYINLIDFNDIHRQLMDFLTEIKKSFFVKSAGGFYKPNGDPVTDKELDALDNFIEQFFAVYRESSEALAIRTFLIGYLWEKSQQENKTFQQKIWDELPTKYKDLQGKYGLSKTEILGIKYGQSNITKNLLWMNSKAQQAVRDIVVQSKYERLTNQQLSQRLFDEMATQEGNLNRDWRRIAITESNTLANEGKVAKIPDFQYIVGRSHQDACKWCLKNINGRVMIKLPSSPPPYEHLDPESQEYKDIAYLWDNALWSGKSNTGRSTSPNKRMVTEHGELVTVGREHHEKAVPCMLCHISGRCSWSRINPKTMFLDNKSQIHVKMDDNIEEYEQWATPVIERANNVKNIYDKLNLGE